MPLSFASMVLNKSPNESPRSVRPYLAGHPASPSHRHRSYFAPMQSGDNPEGYGGGAGLRIPGLASFLREQVPSSGRVGGYYSERIVERKRNMVPRAAFRILRYIKHKPVNQNLTG